MSGPVHPAGGAALKHARRVAGVTQEELAERAKVSVRTVRGLESGTIRNPHQNSLVAVARALHMGEQQIQHFLGCWTKAGEAQTFTALVDAGHDVEQVLADQAIPTHDDYEDISFIETVTIGRDRRMLTSESLVTMRALNDGIDRRLVLWGRDDSGQDLDKAKLVALRNCNAVQRVTLPKLDLIGWELDLGRKLAKGETHVHRYRYGFRAAYPTLGDSRTSREAAHGFRRPLLIWVMQVDFECPPPKQIVQYSGPPRRRRIERELEVDSFGSTHVMGQNLAPGEYGISWTWD